MLLALFVCLGLTPTLQQPQDADWIWGSWANDGDSATDRPRGEICAFLREFDLGAGVERARIEISVDNSALLTVNGERIGRTDDWQTGLRFDLSAVLVAGTNRVEVQARNQGGPAGLIATLEAKLADGTSERITTDETWLTRRDAGESWKPASVIAAYGEQPWGEVSFVAGRRASGDGIEGRFEAPDGFSVSLAWESMASYISMASIDARHVLAGTEDSGVVKLIDEDGDGRFDSESIFSNAVTYCQGLAWVDEGLFCTGRGPEGAGLYRIEAASPDEAELIGLFTGSTGEHGPHAVVAGPDGDLYLVIGNHTGLEAEWSADSPYGPYYEGHLLPRYVDPRGHANKIAAPGGIVVRVDRQGENWSVIAGGLRNAYDIAFNAAGHLFTFDSDMEWDLGLPWYREVRLVHVVPGGEYGWRTGSTKWPDWYPDSLPATCEVGRGSPTGVAHYDGDMFPTRYQGAILAGDWSRGRIVAFHLTARGLSYEGTAEDLLFGRGLNVSDLEVAPDGSLLISTGGRGGAGSLLRLSYEGDRGPQVEASLAPKWLEFPDRAPTAEPFYMLDSPDRFVRFAAALALQQRGLRALDLGGVRDAPSLSEGLVVAARVGLGAEDPEDCAEGLRLATDLVRGGEGLSFKATLRAVALFLQDSDAPPIEELADLGRVILARFPSGDREADRELALLLAHLEPEGTVPELLGAMREAGSRAEQMHLAYALRAVEHGWDDPSRETVAAWFSVSDTWSGGYSLAGYLKQMKRDFKTLFGPQYAALFEDNAGPAAAWSPPPSYGGAAWKHDGILAYLAGAAASPRRDVGEGARVFEASCARCHPLDGGGNLGPDLKSVTGRFPRADLLDAILAPSRVIPEAYRPLDVFLIDGTVHSGLPIEDTEAALILSRSDGTEVQIDPGQIDERRPSPLSTMPDGLLDGLTLEEVADLLTYLEVGGERDPDAASPWTTLFDGESLAGWEFDPALWTVEDGLILGHGTDIVGSSYLISESEWSDFVVEFDLLLLSGNSGLQFRATRTEGFGLDGYQADAGENFWGSLYEEGGRGMLHRTPDTDWYPAVQVDGWNHFVVTADGDHLTVEINGTVTSDIRDAARDAGNLGFQLHAGETELQLRNVRVRAITR